MCKKVTFLMNTSLYKTEIYLSKVQHF